MKKFLLLALLLFMSNFGQTQTTGPGFIIYVGSAPSGTCSAGAYLEQVIGLGTVYTCQSGTWTQISGGGGSGTVTSVICGTNLDGGTITTTGTCSVKASPAFTGVPTSPTAAQGTSTTQVATTAFVATAIQGVNPAVAVQAATVAVLPNSPTYSNGVSGIGATLTAGSAAALVVDGYTPILNDRILVKTQASSFQNGVYFLSTLGTGIIPYVLTRALDFDMPSDMNNTGAIPVINGTVNAVTQWVISSSVTTVGTDAVTFAQFSANPATLAPLASPTFTGTPAAPTASLGTNTTQLATTAFVLANAAMVQVETHTASTSATLDFTTCFSSTYHNYELEFNNLVPATNTANLQLLYSTNGGSTWDSTAGHYAWSVLLINSGGTASDGSGSTTNIAFSTATSPPSNTANLGGVSGNYRVHDPLGAHYTQLSGTTNYVGSGTNASTGLLNSGTYSVTTGAVNAFRVLFSSGNITSGTVTCYGVTP